MEERTLEFDTDIREEELLIYEHTTGVVGVAAYENILNLYYAQPVSEQQLTALARTIKHHQERGATLIHHTLPQNPHVRTIKRVLRTQTVY